MYDRILDFWYAQEFFNPCWPKDEKIKNISKDGIPWPENYDPAKKRVSFDVYIGRIKVADLTNWLIQELHLESDNAPEKSTDLTCLFALKVNGEGQYVEGSFALSSLVWAIAKIVSQGTMDVQLDHKELEQEQEGINEWLTEVQKEQDGLVISINEISTIYETVMHHIKLQERICPFFGRWKKIEVYPDKKGNFPAEQTSTELMQSFYLDDILTVKKHPTDNLKKYVLGNIKSNNRAVRTNIDSDIDEMQKWLQASKYPLGMWPCDYSPSLMQQIAINIAISGEEKIFSVNGPPGTGKTTMLKEIIAHSIIKRAEMMTRYAHPDDAFEGKNFEFPEGKTKMPYYKLKDSLSDYGIVVASANNNAVENVTVELPQAIKADKSGKFRIGKPIRNIYFTDLSSRLYGPHNMSTWGLISAPLGKKKNLKDLKKGIWWTDGFPSLYQYENSENVDWDKAKNDFATALSEVSKLRSSMERAQIICARLQVIKSDIIVLHSNWQNAFEKYKNAETVLANLENHLEALYNSKEYHNQELTRIKESICWLLFCFRRFFKWHKKIQEYNSQCDLVKIIGEDIEATEVNISATKKIVERLKNDADNLNQQKAKAQSDVIFYEKKFEGLRADAEFWKNITTNEISQSSCPWTWPEYDKRREELFYYALQVHKAFYLNSKSARTNLSHLFSLWDGKITGANRKLAYAELFNTLLLVIPVVSTTFASVQSLFSGIGKEKIGLLIVDEAGQATPQSVLGALWRTKHAVIAGDPLQIEPIVTTPRVIREMLMRQYDVPSEYRHPEISVQELADNINKYGGLRTLVGTELWIGCPLITHRRCLDPMFRISNNMAYNGRMFNNTPVPKKEVAERLLMSKSAWVNVKGKETGNKDHSVACQTNIVIRGTCAAFDSYGGLPDIFIISPFKSVTYAIKSELTKTLKEVYSSYVNEIDDWIKNHCGTVHTFQGKEANEVILVLGCDTSRAGESAAKWVGLKPNLINVAVSRAKYRFAAIGDIELWRNVDYVNELCKLPMVADITEIMNIDPNPVNNATGNSNDEALLLC